MLTYLNKKFPSLIFILIITTFNLIPDVTLCQPARNDHLIDSLIQVDRINDQTILVSFGNEAVTVIKTEKGIVVIDAGMTTGLTSRYRNVIEKAFDSDDFSYVINTHGHHDHYRGNSVFDEARVVAHENALEEISRQWKNTKKIAARLTGIAEDYEKQLNNCEPNSREWFELFTQKTRCAFAARDAVDSLPVKHPDLTFSDSLSIEMGDVSLELIHFGSCHSSSDILIFVPELNLLFTGDLFFRYGRPSMDEDLQPDKEKWQKSIEWLEKRIASIDKIIGGHGQILVRDDLESFMRKIRDKI